MKLNPLLKNKNVLYVVAFIAIITVISYISKQDWNAILFFGLIGCISTYFSKNMIIVLSIAIISTNLMIYVKSNGLMEGMKNGSTNGSRRDIAKAAIKKKVTDKTQEVQGNASTGVPKKGSKLDYASTLEKAYENLDNLVGSEGINNMTKHSERLAKQQKNLMKGLENLAPLMDTATSMMDKLGPMQEKIGSFMDKVKP